MEISQNKRESYIIADDGTYLGNLNPTEFDQRSIFNSFGPYGSEFSQISIFNQFSNYGSQFSQTPPKVYLNGEFVGLLTVNEFLSGNKINPNTIKEWSEEHVSRY